MRNLLLANGGWLLRVVTMAALIAVIALSLFPRVVSHISTSAVINAPVMVIRSPVEGVVEEYALDTGFAVSQGQPIVAFREAGTDLTQQADLQARLLVSEAAAQAVTNRIADVETLLARLVRRQDAYATWHTAILEREVAQLEAQVRAAQVRLDAFDEQADRLAVLSARGMVSDSDVTEANTQAHIAQERVHELEAALDAQRLKLRAMEEGILAGTDGTNTPYTLQRQDEIGLELARLRDERSDHLAEAQALREQLAVERDTYERQNRISLASPVTGVVWRSASLAGRPVLPGDEVVEILDCSARFLEAYLPERLIGTVSLGDLAQVRLTGDDRVFHAPVISVLGHGARFDHTELAAQDNTPKTGKMRVLIELGRRQLGFDPNRFCHVGRTAQVSLPRDFSGVERMAEKVRSSFQTIYAWLFETGTPNRRG